MKHGSFTGLHKLNQINPIIGNSKKTFILRKLAKIEDKADILTKIEKSLNNENNFLEMNSEIIIGKRNHGPRYDDNQEPIPYTYVGPAASLKPKKIVFRMSMPSQRIKGLSLSPKTLSSSSLGSSKNTLNKTTNNSINIKKSISCNKNKYARGGVPKESDFQPTNGEFIALVSDRLRIRESA